MDKRVLTYKEWQKLDWNETFPQDENGKEYQAYIFVTLRYVHCSTGDFLEKTLAIKADCLTDWLRGKEPTFSEIDELIKEKAPSFDWYPCEAIAILTEW